MNTDPPSVFGFLEAISRHWVTAMIGALYFPFSVLAVFASSDLSRTIWIVAASCLFLVATYRVWSAERSVSVDVLNKINTLNEEIKILNDRNSPKIRLEWHQTMIGRHTESNGRQSTLFFVNCAAINAGHPAALDHWQGDVFYNNRWHELQLHYVHGTTHIGLDPENDLHLVSTDMLYAKASHPIERGEQVRGWLHFRLLDVSREETGNDRKLRISCQDVLTETRWVAEKFINNEGHRDLQYYPDPAGRYNVTTRGK